MEEDFAESFASYVHTQLQHRPWKVVLKPTTGPLRVIGDCWSEPRCGPKRLFLDDLLREPFPLAKEPP